MPAGFRISYEDRDQELLDGRETFFDDEAEARAWYRDDRIRSMAEGRDIAASVSSATRSPGKYSLKWDGKDNAGKTVKAGKYTVCIEAAREHGTYQIYRQEVDFDGVPRQIPLQGGTEIASASLDYAKRAH